MPMSGVICPAINDFAGAPSVSDTCATDVGTTRSTGAFIMGERKGLLKAAPGFAPPGLLKGALTPSAGLAMGLVDLGDNGAPRAGSSSSAMSALQVWHGVPTIASVSRSKISGQQHFLLSYELKTLLGWLVFREAARCLAVALWNCLI